MKFYESINRPKVFRIVHKKRSRRVSILYFRNSNVQKAKHLTRINLQGFWWWLCSLMMKQILAQIK